MRTGATLETLGASLRRQAELLTVLTAELSAYLQLKQERHDQLTRRYERLERRTDAITNPGTVRARRLLADYERLSERHARSEEELDDLENLALEPLGDAQDVLSRLVA